MNNNLKVPYELVYQQWDKLYAKEFPPGTDDKVIEKHCEEISDFVENCGWTVEDFMEEYMRRGLDEIFPDPKKQN